MNTSTARKDKQIRDHSVPAFWSLALLLSVAMILGGGGSRFPMYEMLVQLAAIPALAIGLGKSANLQSWKAIRFPVIILFCAIALILIQLIPLPPALWQAMPGREYLSQAAELTGQVNGWRSWSINPEITAQSGISLILPVAVLLAARLLDTRQSFLLLLLMTALIMANLSVAFLQAVSGGGSFYLYDTSHKGLPIGLFANRNHMAQLLLMGMFLVGGLLFAYGSRASGGRIMAAIGILLVLVFSVIATNSRTVSALVVPAFLFLIFIILSLKTARFGKKIGIAVALIAASIAAILFAFGRSGAIGKLLERFTASDDHRFEFWPDALDTMWAYFPFGSGLGTFDMVFRAHEKLTSVGTQYVNNAHNDYLELAIETGIFGPILIVFLLVWFLIRIIRLIRLPHSGERRIAQIAAAALIAIAIHSLIDYPLRSYAIMVPASFLLAAFAFGTVRNGAKTSGSDAVN